MALLHHASLGYAANPAETLRIIHETGIFYLSISLGYLLSFLYMYRYSASIKKMKRSHIFLILMWGFVGGILILDLNYFALVCNVLILVLAIIVLYQLHSISIVIAQSTLIPPDLPSDDKKKIYTDNLLKKHNYVLSDFVSAPLINEHILWLLIFYRAAITLRAYLEL